MEYDFSRQILEKIWNTKILWKSGRESSFTMRTDTHDEVKQSVFRDFASASKKKFSFYRIENALFSLW
jgi:hypothetical protein